MQFPPQVAVSNTIEALKIAKKKGEITLGLLGRDGGTSLSYCNYLAIKCADTAKIQEMLILIGHILYDLIEKHLHKNEKNK